VTLPTFRLGMPADRDMSALARKFSEAMRAGDDLDRAIGLWSKAIKMAPENSATWSNRGTVLLQAGRWQEARDDLDHASFIDQAGVPDPLVLNNLANAEGALGNWDTAIELYSQAAGVIDPEILAIAMANKSLACFQTGHEDAAIRLTAWNSPAIQYVWSGWPERHPFLMQYVPLQLCPHSLAGRHTSTAAGSVMVLGFI